MIKDSYYFQSAAQGSCDIMLAIYETKYNETILNVSLVPHSWQHVRTGLSIMYEFTYGAFREKNKDIAHKVFKELKEYIPNHMTCNSPHSAMHDLENQIKFIAQKYASFDVSHAF